jgi:hypothetical protein
LKSKFVEEEIDGDFDKERYTSKGISKAHQQLRLIVLSYRSG